MIAFKDGAISGFLSNLITTVLSMCTKTVKQIVKMIRVGSSSLIKAVMLLASPPKDMTLQQAAHEASKLIASALTLAMDVLAEEAISATIKNWLVSVPPLLPFADLLVTVIMGLVTGLSTVLAVYLIDQVDIFGVNEEERHRDVDTTLDRVIDNSLKNARSISELL